MSKNTSYRSPVIRIGDLLMGGDQPVRVQSMTNTDTLDTKASVAQCIRIIGAGGELVRLTAQGTREAENLESIKKELRRAGFSTPLVADIHFNPAAAELAARIVEKVRINPGNYVDRRASFIKTELTDKEYGEELERIHARLLPLIKICTENSTVIRLGINHGSLSDRIMTRYGNTARGMVVSAMEFIAIFRSENFNNLVLSLKSSDTAVMLEANRLLTETLMQEGFAYPLHLGVTEAGEGEDGRIRSAAGIGALLAEGIGDTIRVSLSEDPEFEIPVAKEILGSFGKGSGRISREATKLPFEKDKFLYKPQVLTFSSDRYLDENGGVFSGKVKLVTEDSLSAASPAPEKGYVVAVDNDTDDPVVAGIRSAAMLGRYFILRQADGICLRSKGNIDEEKLKEISFSILQATEARITRTRYISCPTCGRTKFNLQEAVRKVKAATSHLSGLKIAVMGCIVNGPGEMAGADYGYVGAGEGKVHIYRGTVPVLKHVPEEKAVEELLRIIAEG
jgi:(E)-4-hydroxy-3-methylbut-2-enyl-diphosphate synthase